MNHLAIRIAVGVAAGSGVGYSYHLLMRAVGSTCINCRVPIVPVTVCAVIGLIVALSWKP